MTYYVFTKETLDYFFWVLSLGLLEFLLSPCKPFVGFKPPGRLDFFSSCLSFACLSFACLSFGCLCFDCLSSFRFFWVQVFLSTQNGLEFIFRNTQSRYRPFHRLCILILFICVNASLRLFRYFIFKVIMSSRGAVFLLYFFAAVFRPV